MKRLMVSLLSVGMILSVIVLANAWTPAVKDDPHLRMPGTQPDQGVNLEAPNRCLNCHSGYNQAVEPGFNWMGSMMAQSARDPIFWACMTVAGQDSVWALVPFPGGMAGWTIGPTECLGHDGFGL